MKIKFINHSCYLVELDNCLILNDPWVEGKVFDNSWSLIDDSSSINEVIELLKKNNKKLFIKISHEHPDHFSIPFISQLSKTNLKPTFLVRHTEDKRVLNFLRKLNFDSFELNEGDSTFLQDDATLKIFPHNRIDSYSLLEFGDYALLDINDCVFTNHEIKRLGSIHQNPNILMLQYGYASSIGLYDDKSQREDAVRKKAGILELFNETLNPEVIIPFASYSYFCDPMNYHLNYEQNNPKKLLANIQSKTSKKIRFMKYGDIIDLSSDGLKQNFESNESLNYWMALMQDLPPPSLKGEAVTIQTLDKSFRLYRAKILQKNPFIFLLLILLGYFRGFKLHLEDLDASIKVSIFSGVKEISGKKFENLIMDSSTLNFTFCNDFGVDTLVIGGKFKAKNSKALSKCLKFFQIQNIMKNKYTKLYLFKSLIRRLVFVDT